MGSRRLSRMEEEIKKLISTSLINGIKDPRVSMLTTVTDVELTNDLRYVKIFISVMGTDREKADTLKGLNSAKNFIRKEIGSKIKLRYTPEPIFEEDKSLDYGMNISKIISDMKKDK